MLVFNGKNTSWISESPWYTLECGCKLAHCLKFSTKQCFKGAEFLKSPKYLTFRWIYFIRQSLVRLQNTPVKVIESVVFPRWGSSTSWCVYSVCYGSKWCSHHIITCRSSAHFRWGSVYLDSSVALAPASLGTVHGRPRGVSHQLIRGHGLCSEMRPVLLAVRLILLFVIVISGWGFWRNMTCGVVWLNLTSSLDSCGSLPQLRKSSLCRRKRLLFESLIAFWLLWPDVLN